MKQAPVISCKQYLPVNECTQLLHPLLIILLLQMLVVSSVTTITKQHYLLINGPMHTRALINTTVQFKCRVQLLIQNIGPIENKCTQMANETNPPTCSSSSTASSLTPSSSSSASASGEVWQIIKPNLLPDKLDIIVQWMKDGFGYDRDGLRQTFGGRYTMMESKEKDMYDLTIHGVRYEDEGEYACQARLVEKSNSIHLTASHTKLDRKSINSDRINYDSSKSEFLMHDPLALLPMSLIKSNTANLNIVVPPKSVNLNILIYENLKSKFLINTKNQYNYLKSSSFRRMNQTQNQQSVWLHLNKSIQLICTTSSWSKPLGKIKWSINNDDDDYIFDDIDDHNKSINADLSSRISHSFDFHLKRKFPFDHHHLHGLMNKQVKTEEEKEEELLSWLNSAYCDSNYQCHIMNRTKKSIVLK
ncbi:unnamed protein product [Trichobilharzia szidati]|nr:unnamed protein product [Trichobilharzia szidati]